LAEGQVFSFLYVLSGYQLVTMQHLFVYHCKETIQYRIVPGMKMSRKSFSLSYYCLSWYCL